MIIDFYQATTADNAQWALLLRPDRFPALPPNQKDKGWALVKRSIVGADLRVSLEQHLPDLLRHGYAVFLQPPLAKPTSPPREAAPQPIKEAQPAS